MGARVWVPGPTIAVSEGAVSWVQFTVPFYRSTVRDTTAEHTQPLETSGKTG